MSDELHRPLRCARAFRREAAFEGPNDVIAAVTTTVPAGFALAITAASAPQPEGSLR